MMVTKRPELAVGVLGLGLLQIVSLFETTAPSLEQLRGASDGDTTEAQNLLDATILVGSVVVFVAFIATISTGSSLPAFIFIGGFGLVATWHYLVLHSPQV